MQVNNIVDRRRRAVGARHGDRSADGALKSLKLAPLRMSASDDLKLDLDGGATTKLTIRGASLDARGFVKGLTGGGRGGTRQERSRHRREGRPPRQATARAHVGLRADGARRNGVFDESRRTAARPRRVSARSGEGGVLNIKSDDAGSLARFLDLYDKLEGGDHRPLGQRQRRSARGGATIKKFSIRDEPSLKQARRGGAAATTRAAAPARRRRSVAAGASSTS